MIPQIQERDWYEIDTAHGAEFIPAELVGSLECDPESDWDHISDYISVFNLEQVYSIERRSGFGCRLSAPGYMDCTEWSVFNTESEARSHLAEFYDLCSICLSELDFNYSCPEC